MEVGNRKGNWVFSRRIDNKGNRKGIWQSGHFQFIYFGLNLTNQTTNNLSPTFKYLDNIIETYQYGVTELNIEMFKYKT